MKGRNLVLTALITLAAGILMLVFRTTLASGTIITWLGIVCIVAGVLNIGSILGGRDENGHSRAGALTSTFGWIAGGAAVILGLVMAIFHASFVALVGYLFGILLLFFALFQILLLVFGSRPSRLPGFYYVVPALLICGGIYIFTLKAGLDELSIMTFTGAGLTLFGAATLAECVQIGKNNRARRAGSASETAPESAEEPRTDTHQGQN